MERFDTPVRRAQQSLGRLSRRSILGPALAVLAACGAMTAAAALTPEPAAPSASKTSALTTSASTSSATATGTSTPTTATASAPASAIGDEGADSGGEGGGESASTVGSTPGGTASASATATGTGVAAAAANDPHTNGNGCDDIIHAEDRKPAPGGALGCTVGNSGDHRQNGKTATSTATPTATGTAAASPTGEKADPHANGHGCDDVNPAVIDGTPSHGGPVDCAVGNSAGHRQNGKNAATATPAPAGSEPAAATATSGTTNGHGNSGSAGKKAK